MAGIVDHPNVAAYVILSLGCEVNQPTDMIEATGLGNGHEPLVLTIQQDGGFQKTVEQGIAAVEKLLPAANEARRARLTVPGDPNVLAGLARAYRSPDGLNLTITDRDGGKTLSAGFIEGPIATRKNPDGSVSIVTVGPGSIGVDALVGVKDGKRTLSIRDSQHEYLYTEI